MSGLTSRKNPPNSLKDLSEVFITEAIESVGVQVMPCLTENWWEQWGTEMLSCK